MNIVGSFLSLLFLIVTATFSRSQTVPRLPVWRQPQSNFDEGRVGSVVELKLSEGQRMKFCYCPPGTFTTGSPETEPGRGDDEGPVEVRISKGFWMAQTELTQEQWEAIMGIGSNPSHFKGAMLPVEGVSWDEAVACIEKLNAMVKMPVGWNLALPTEAQWEYACRAGTKTVFSFGNQLNGKEANCDGNYPYGTNVKGPFLGQTVEVGKYAANPWGLFDMHGNVWEWCAERHYGTISGTLDSHRPASRTVRFLRGGSWKDDARFCRAGFRYKNVLGNRSSNLGFRVVAVPAEPLVHPIAPSVATTVPTPTSALTAWKRGPDEWDTGRVGRVVDLKLSGEQVINLCYCPPGTLTMGSAETEAERRVIEGPTGIIPRKSWDVKISKGFWMAQTEVTQAQWEAIMGIGSNPSHFKGAMLPVERVSWDDAVACIEKLNAMVKMPVGWKLALPTEAQWEYACRAGTKTVFSFGNQLDGKEANCNGNVPYGTTVEGLFLEKTVEVGKYAPNPWGLFDMHGNVWEWCADCYDPTLSVRPDPKGTATGCDRVIRGGGWNTFAGACRAGCRVRCVPGSRIDYLGFRVVAVPERP